ncbi:MAG: hypothetical protein JRH11_00280 [Deltaproteobacteria bacterium]|nr:hypothetical protein [Deltaproteobacteria bacterium]
MADDFKAAVRRAYALDGQRVLILELGYRGDVVPGEQVDVTTGDRVVRATVANVAWGSAFHAKDTPLTLVVTGLDEDPAEGSAVCGVAGE